MFPQNDTSGSPSRGKEKEREQRIFEAQKREPIHGSLVTNTTKYTLFPAKNQALTRWYPDMVHHQAAACPLACLCHTPTHHYTHVEARSEPSPTSLSSISDFVRPKRIGECSHLQNTSNISALITIKEYTASLSIQPTHRHPLTRNQIIRSSALWSLQVLLALLFLFAGSMKLLTPIEVMKAQMSLPLSDWFIYFTGIAEFAGALGLILPGLLRIKRGLTPLAACGLVLVMIGATALTMLTAGVIPALFPALVGLLCTLVAKARASWARAA
jgi:uncharacterized membrane protein YphA (DoxX/SURF4 family)